MTFIKNEAQMVLVMPSYDTLKAANSDESLGTLQPNESVPLALNCPISVESGGVGGSLEGIYIDHIQQYRNLFLTPQLEMFFTYLKLDRALMLDNGSFTRNNYSNVVNEIDSAVLDSLLEDYLSTLTKKRIHKKSHSVGLNMIVANLIQSFFTKRLLLISRMNGVVQENNPSNIDNRLIARLCDWLSDEGYIELLIQPKQHPSMAQSAIYATEKLIRRVINYRVIQSGNPVVIRNNLKEEIKIPDKKSVLLKVKSHREVLEAYSKLMSDLLVTLDGIQIPVHGRRIFNGTIDLGGRFYSSYQSLPSGDRKRIKINHEQTIELDYKTLHYNLLYSIVGTRLVGDPYLVDGYDRTAIKVISFMLLNTDSQAGLKELARMITLSGKPEQIEAVNQYDKQRAMYDRQLTRGLRADAPYKAKNIKYHIDLIPENTDGKKLVSDLLERHTAIKHLIGSKDIGLRLQNMDSNIIKDVMRLATSEGIALLFVHDSCICKRGDKTRVKEIMLEVYKGVTGFSIRVTQPKR